MLKALKKLLVCGTIAAIYSSTAAAAIVASGSITDPIGDNSFRISDITGVNASVDSSGVTTIAIDFSNTFNGNTAVSIFLDATNNGLTGDDVFLQFTNYNGSTSKIKYIFGQGFDPQPNSFTATVGATDITFLIPSTDFLYSGDAFGVGVTVSDSTSSTGNSGVGDVAPGPTQLSTFLVSPVQVPAPLPLSLLGIGALGIAASRRRSKARAKVK